MPFFAVLVTFQLEGRSVDFLGIAQTFGCSKCLKEFPGSIGTKDYSGFDRSEWVARTNENHRDCVQQILKCKTKSDRARLESHLGCRYSVLLDIPYFDAPRMLLVDPMHNLFHGTAKKMLNIWLEQDIISSRDFLKLQSLVDSYCTPTDIGRLPTKISTAFAGFTADQHKNWVTIFSIPCLFGVLPVWGYSFCSSGVLAPLCSFLSTYLQARIDTNKHYISGRIVNAVLQKSGSFVWPISDYTQYAPAWASRKFFWTLGQYMSFGCFHSKGIMGFWVTNLAITKPLSLNF